ncbi:unnamed protein product [Alopecurus aequalis]
MSLNPLARRAARAPEHGAPSAFAGLAAATSRIASHGRAGDAVAARAVFDAIPSHDAVARNAMLTAYVRAGQPRAALALFARMRGAPDAFALTAALSATMALRCPAAGAQLHARLLRLGLRAPLPVGNALVAMYARCARAEDAARAFREMPEHNALSWCSLLHAYAASGRMKLAQDLFDEMPAGSNVAWNTLLMGYSHIGNSRQCLLVFNRMRMSGLSSDDATLCILIDACTELPYPSTGFAVHKIAVHSGWNAVPEVSNSLISFYSKFSLLDHAVKIFESMGTRTIVSWNSLIDAYTRLGHIEEAAALFQSAPETNVISWTAMIGGYARNGCADEALALFVKMLTEKDIQPDDFTLGSVLHACATTASLATGRMIHACAFQRGFASYLYVANSLMDMYAKCGDIEGASNVFNAILQKDLVSWNTMLFGFAINGWANEALELYETMLFHDVCPDEVTFAGLLTACSHSCLLEQGRAFFESMVFVHRLKPTPEHLACVLDMYARSGNIKQAIEMLDQYSEMVQMPNSNMRESLLSAYSSGHLDVRIGRKVGSSMVSTDPARDAGYVMLSNLLCATGQWTEAERVRRTMSEHGVKKSPGCSWIQVKGAVKVFVSGAQELVPSDVVGGIIHLLDKEMRTTTCCDA